jgi:sporulation protein YlmC with PRC-barrel domain
MADYDFNIGAVVTCQGEKCGRLSKVAVDPQTAEVTDLIVQVGVLRGAQLVVPISSVVDATHDVIYLDVTEADLYEFPEYREVEYTVPESRWDDAGAVRPEAERQIHSGMLYPATFPTVRHTVHEGIGVDKAVLERGTEVRTIDSALGHLDHLLIDRQTERVTHLVINRGLLSPDLVLPMNQVRRVTEGTIYVELDRDLRDYDRYVAREEVEIWDDLHDHMAELAPGGGVEMTLDRGILRLTGIVRDVASKRRIEAAARSVRGIIDVENELETDTTIVARVVAALAVDPRTELSQVAVAADGGIVRLAGQVDDEMIRRAAEEIAGRQPGSKGVQNDLTVGIDESTEWLLFRPMRAEEDSGR